MSGTASQEVFDKDAVRFDTALRELGAVSGPDEDGNEWLDESRVPADLLRAYRGFIAYGYANGLMP